MTTSTADRRNLTYTLTGSGDTVTIRGAVVGEEAFNDGLQIRTPTDTDAGWNGTRVLTTLFLVDDVLRDGESVDAVILIQAQHRLGRRHEPLTLFIKTTVTGTGDGCLIVEGGGRISIEEDLYGISI